MRPFRTASRSWNATGSSIYFSLPLEQINLVAKARRFGRGAKLKISGPRELVDRLRFSTSGGRSRLWWPGGDWHRTLTVSWHRPGTGDSVGAAMTSRTKMRSDAPYTIEVWVPPGHLTKLTHG
jgi:hypothetical protein